MQVAISFSSILQEGQKVLSLCRCFMLMPQGLPIPVRWWGPHLFLPALIWTGKAC